MHGAHYLHVAFAVANVISRRRTNCYIRVFFRREYPSRIVIQQGQDSFVLFVLIINVCGINLVCYFLFFFFFLRNKNNCLYVYGCSTVAFLLFYFLDALVIDESDDTQSMAQAAASHLRRRILGSRPDPPSMSASALDLSPVVSLPIGSLSLVSQHRAANRIDRRSIEKVWKQMDRIVKYCQMPKKIGRAHV